MTSLETITELYRSFREADYDAFRSLCAPDILWVQSAGFPGGAAYTGVDAIIAGVFERNASLWDGFRFVTEGMHDAGDTVLVTGRYEGVHRESGRALSAAVAHVYDLTGGRVTRFRMFADTKTICDSCA